MKITFPGRGNVGGGLDRRERSGHEALEEFSEPFRAIRQSPGSYFHRSAKPGELQPLSHAALMLAVSLAIGSSLLSVVAVLSSLYPVVTIALARRYLGEQIQHLQLLGIALALGGAAAISVA